jgi:hypothetical protein
MDTAIDLSDASKALDLANIRFQLMLVSCLVLPALTEVEISAADLKIQSPST